MSTAAILMMVLAMLVLWGGLALAVVRLSRSPEDADLDPSTLHRDL